MPNINRMAKVQRRDSDLGRPNKFTGLIVTCVVLEFQNMDERVLLANHYFPVPGQFDV